MSDKDKNPDFTLDIEEEIEFDDSIFEDDEELEKKEETNEVFSENKEEKEDFQDLITEEELENLIIGIDEENDILDIPDEEEVLEELKFLDESFSMPSDLKDRMLKSINFQTAYSLGENLAATCLDLAWHELTPEQVPSAYMAGAFEKEALFKAGVLNTQIPPRYSTTYFNHVWGGGYAAGYYSYLWANVLDNDAFEAFKEHGIFDKTTADLFRRNVLEKGDSEDPMTLYKNFRGAEPQLEPMLKNRGMK